MKVLIADDHKILCEGLRALLEKQKNVQVVGTAYNGREVIKMASDLQPDLVIMDVAMPELNGMEATQHILRQNPGIKVIALSMHSDRRYVCGMLSAGVCGYILKDGAFDEIEKAINTVSSNQVYLSSAITGVVVDSLLRNVSVGAPGKNQSTVKNLSSREREVLQLLAEGNTVKDIASKLHLSIKTIETHRRQIMEKLEMHSVADLTKYAIKEGLISLEN